MELYVNFTILLHVMVYDHKELSSTPSLRNQPYSNRGCDTVLPDWDYGIHQVAMIDVSSSNSVVVDRDVIITSTPAYLFMA
jgi:hypothetical protein